MNGKAIMNLWNGSKLKFDPKLSSDLLSHHKQIPHNSTLNRCTGWSKSHGRNKNSMLQKIYIVVPCSFHMNKQKFHEFVFWAKNFFCQSPTVRSVVVQKHYFKLQIHMYSLFFFFVSSLVFSCMTSRNKLTRISWTVELEHGVLIFFLILMDKSIPTKLVVLIKSRNNSSLWSPLRLFFELPDRIPSKIL